LLRLSAKETHTHSAAVYHDPSRFAVETIEYYVTPLVSLPLHRAQYEKFHIALEPNPLAEIEASLKRSVAFAQTSASCPAGFPSG